MNKLLLTPVLLLLACLFAGVYGILHNQITYTVSPDYFHQFKFIQFNIHPTWHSRIGAASVGWMASWWMGLIIGLCLLPIGLLLSESKYAAAMLKAFIVVSITALIIGIGALIYAYFTLTPENVPQIVFKFQPNDPVAFWRAATMHNFSYIGGLIGMFTGIIYLLYKRKQEKKMPTEPNAFTSD